MLARYLTVNMTRQLPDFLRNMIDAPPRAGEGVHNWLFRMARQLHAHLPSPEIVALLETRVANCGRHVPRHEIVSAVQSSLPYAWQPGRNAVVQSGSKWPCVNQKQRAAIIRDGGGLADLWEASRIRIESNNSKTESIVDALFPGNPLLCCGESKSEFDTKPREQWRGQLGYLQLIVPSPMTTLKGLTRDGKESAHALSNTGPRRFLVVEFDQGTADEHAALILYLGTCAPLVCAVHSGGKSLHGWFYVQGLPELKVESFFRHAVLLGADPATWTRSQFVRMPDGWRPDGKDLDSGKVKPQRQTVYFLNFKPLCN